MKNDSCIEIEFLIKDNPHYQSCWMGKMQRGGNVVYWYGLVPDGSQAYDYAAFFEFAAAPVFFGKTLREVWANVELLSIDGCEPKERMEFYLSKEQASFIEYPDVEVLFEFNGTRKHPAKDGYRPHHLIAGQLTTGVHRYYDTQSVAPDGTAKGTITFLMPEAYSHSLQTGRKIPIQEGERVVGCATVLYVWNPILREKGDVCSNLMN